MMSIVLSAMMLAPSAHAQTQAHACAPTVISQAKQKLASQVKVKSISVKSAESRDDVTLFTLKVTSTKAGRDVIEIAEARANADCDVMGEVEILPDSEKAQ